MPRIAKSDRDKRFESIGKRIRHFYDDLLRDRDMDCFDAAKTLGMEYGVLNRRLAHPEKITVEELFAVANAMNIAPETLIGKAEVVL